MRDSREKVEPDLAVHDRRCNKNNYYPSLLALAREQKKAVTVTAKTGQFTTGKTGKDQLQCRD